MSEAGLGLCQSYVSVGILGTFYLLDGRNHLRMDGFVTCFISLAWN